MGLCALQEVSATKSGIINLMMLLGFVLILMASKVSSSPYRLLGPLCIWPSGPCYCPPSRSTPDIHSGLVTTSSSAQAPVSACYQAWLQPPDITMMFSQTLGGSLFMTVAQNVYKCRQRGLKVMSGNRFC